MTEEKQKTRTRPSAKDARARMGLAVSSQTPQSRTETAAEAGEAGEARSAAEPTEKLTRLSVDVPRSQHRYLRVLAAESGVTGMAVIRALLEESESDPELAGRVRERLAESG